MSQCAVEALLRGRRRQRLSRGLSLLLVELFISVRCYALIRTLSAHEYIEMIVDFRENVSHSHALVSFSVRQHRNQGTGSYVS